MQRRAPRGKFLIVRSNQRTAKARELGMIRAIVGEKRFNRRTIRQLDGVFRVTDDLFEAAEKKDLHARGLESKAHKRIVTR